MKNIVLIIGLLIVFNFGSAQEAVIKSLDETIKLEVYLELGKPMYSVQYNEDVVLEKSQLGLKTNISDYSEGLTRIMH